MLKATLTIFICLLLLNSSAVNAKALTCGGSISIDIPGQVQEKSQKIDLNESISLGLKQMVVTSSFEGNKLAANAICQTLYGTKYTGKDDEWSKFYKSAAQGLVAAKYTELSLTLVGENDAILKNNRLSREYIIKGTKSGIEHVIYNVAVLSQDLQSILTLSISGNSKVKDNVYNLFKNLTNLIEIEEGK